MKELLSHLGRGGKYQYFIQFGEKGITSFELFEVGKIPDKIKDNSYFSVNPVNKKPVNKKSSINDVVALNCLFAEFDSKDFSGEKYTSEEWSLEPMEKRMYGNTKAEEYIYSLEPRPSVIVFSGGGYHCYWLLKDPVLVNDDNRGELNRIQNRWVQSLRGDNGAKDISRVLRVPNTKNLKYNPPIDVKIIDDDYNLLYSLDDLLWYLPEEENKPKNNPASPNVDYSKVLRALFSLRQSRVDDYHSWIEIGMILHSLGEENFSLWDSWSRQSRKYQEGDCKQKWSTFKNSGGLSIATLFHYAKEDNPQLNVNESSVKDSLTNNFEIDKASIILPNRETESNKNRWTVAELLDTQLPEINWAIPNLIPEGLTILGGRPKVGKSWLVLQMLHAVGTGGMFFGEKVEKGNCLYIALEDNARRLQSRIKSQGVPRDASITFVREWLPLQGKGYDQLVKEITEGNYRLIVIDTLTRAFPGLDQNDQTQISRVMDSIQRLSADNNVAIIFIDHTAKPKGINSDPIDDIMNSTVKVAVSDQILALYKEQGKAGARLKGRGRELEEIDYSLSWDRDFCIWQKEGDTNEVRISREKQDIIESLKELGKASNSDIAKYLGKDRGNIHRTLSNLVNDGLVRREDIQGKKYYELSEVVQHNTTYTTLHNTHNNYNTDYEEEF